MLNNDNAIISFLSFIDYCIPLYKRTLNTNQSFQNTLPLEGGPAHRAEWVNTAARELHLRPTVAKSPS